jgi:hypothetical protein
VWVLLYTIQFPSVTGAISVPRIPQRTIHRRVIGLVDYWFRCIHQRGRMERERRAQIMKKSRSHLTILAARRVTCSKLRAEDPQILGTKVQNLLATVNCCREAHARALIAVACTYCEWEVAASLQKQEFVLNSVTLHSHDVRQSNLGTAS